MGMANLLPRHLHHNCVLAAWIFRRKIVNLLRKPAQRRDAKVDRSRFVAQQQESINRASKELADARATREAESLRLRRTQRETPPLQVSNSNSHDHSDFQLHGSGIPRPAANAAATPVANELPSESIPPHRVIAHKAFSRFYTLDLSHPSMRVWIRTITASGMNPPEELIRAFCYNKTQPDRVCPYCGIQYMPLPRGEPTSSSAAEKLEEERRLSGICSRVCFAKTGVSPDDHFGKAAEKGVISAGVVSTVRADGTSTVTSWATSCGAARTSISVVGPGGADAQTTIRECKRCSRCDVQLKLCGACHQVAYCSADCQLKDRPEHKSACHKGKKVLTALHSEW